MCLCTDAQIAAAINRKDAEFVDVFAIAHQAAKSGEIESRLT